MTSGWKLKGTERERYVEGMFDRIAAPYDRLNRLISLGRDGSWRRELVRQAELRPGDTAVDLGTGTGDLGLLLARAVGPGGRVAGLDLSAAMLRVAQAKGSAAPWYSLYRASAAATGIEDGVADAVAMGWVLRNVGDRAAVYREVLRILKPGGRFLCIDMSRPRGLLSRAGFFVYRHSLMPVLARLGGGDAGAYRYLAGSTDRFPGAAELAGEWRAAGFADVTFKPLMMGSLAIHRGVAPAAGREPTGRPSGGSAP